MQGVEKKRILQKIKGIKIQGFERASASAIEISAWLFTLNGQRFPTITVEDGKNLLLRLGNLSPNVAYWLELENESTGTKLP